MDVLGISRAGCRAVVTAAISISVLAACESRFADKQPVESGSGIGFEGTGFARLNASEDLDQRIARIEDTSARIQKIMNDFRRIRKAESGKDVYTQLDFFFDLNRELKRAPAVTEGTKFVKLAKLELKLAGISPECKLVETKLESVASEGSAVSDTLEYSVKTCKTNGNFRRVLSVSFGPTASGIKFDNDGLKDAFADLLIPAIKVDTNCKFEFSQKKELVRASCENIVANLSASERLVFDKFQYDRTADPRFLAEGTITENGKPKMGLLITVDASDRPNIVPIELPGGN